MKKQHLTWAFFILMAISVVSFLWNYHLIRSSNNKLVLNKSRAFFEQILVTRTWNAEHGGVYVPVTKETQPNKYLKDSLRDVETTDGMMLTKINPAFMTRQIAELNKTNYDIQFHITSLNPIRPENKADKWESQSLKKFENGAIENIELTKNDSISEYRYMAPLYTEKSCLKCHSTQGYQYGDIRGGISISFPAKSYLEIKDSQLVSMGSIHFFIFILGILGLTTYYKISKRYTATIENKNRELEELNATKDKFFAIIAHDLKSPFNSIVGFSEHLSEQVKKRNCENVDEIANIILDSSNDAMDLLNNLMSWSQLESGKMPFRPQKFDLSTIAAEEINLLQAASTQKSIHVKNNLLSGTLVFADKDMIKAVFRNLVSNAIKFTRPEGKIAISSATKTNEITITITDNGVGIPADKIEKLFKINEDISTPGTQDEKGTGLGLILSKEFIEKNGGKIQVESQEGIGSTFSFSLPIDCHN